MSLLGDPVIEIGHTQAMAWSHTVNYLDHFALYQVTLAPGRPTSYRYDGRVKPMTPETVSVSARTAEGSLHTRSHTFWLTRYGPMVNLAPPVVSWGSTNGYAIEDVTTGNLRFADQFLAMDQAQSVGQVRAALIKWQGMPFINTIAADRAGQALNANLSIIPHITDKQVRDCVVPAVGSILLEKSRLPVLDGSRPACGLGSDPDAVQPGIFGPRHLPRLAR